MVSATIIKIPVTDGLIDTIDYDEVSAPVVRLGTIKLIISLAA